jgi:hypothetical protein
MILQNQSLPFQTSEGTAPAIKDIDAYLLRWINIGMIYHHRKDLKKALQK